MSSTGPTEKEKLQVIFTADSQLLRTVLHVVCTNNAEALDLAWQVVAKADGFGLKGQKRKADDDADVTEQEAKRVKAIEDVHRCARCNKTFFESKNHEKACWYHPNPEPEEQDIDLDTIRYKQWSNKEYDWEDEEPECIFTCCDTPIEEDTGGCKYARHWATDDPRGPPPPDSEAGDDES